MPLLFLPSENAALTSFLKKFYDKYSTITIWLTLLPVFCGPHHPGRSCEPREKSRRVCSSFSLSSLPVKTNNQTLISAVLTLSTHHVKGDSNFQIQTKEFTNYSCSRTWIVSQDHSRDDLRGFFNFDYNHFNALTTEIDTQFLRFRYYGQASLKS